MLDPDYLLQIADGAEQIASELHTEIVNRIIKRIAARLAHGDNYILTQTDKWQIDVLQESGLLLEDIQNEIAKKTKLQRKEIKEAFEDAGIKTIKYDNEIYKAAGLNPQGLLQSPNLIRIMERAYNATNGEWDNMTRTTANAAQKLFIRECDKAYNLVSSGAVSYTEAFINAVEAISKDGVVVTYPSGHTDTIETATLRAVRTGISQACADVTDARMEEMEWDIVLVSAHLGARVTEREDYTNHYWWQGQFYSKSGKDKRFKPFYVCGFGDVQGIHGANCRHSHGPGDGENNPFQKFDSEENKKAYELTQRQRLLERKIRKTRREALNLKTAMESVTEKETKASLESKYRKKAELLQKQNKEYKNFCDENGLKHLDNRLKVAKWDRKQEISAEKAAKIRNKALEFIENDSIIKSESGLPQKLVDLPDERLQYTVNVNIEKSAILPNGFNAVVAKNSTLKKVEVMAGNGTRTPIRDLRRLYETYNKSPQGWQKKSGTSYGESYHYVIHWYEHDGYIPAEEIKLKGMKENK